MRVFVDLTLTRRLPGLRGGIPRVERQIANALRLRRDVGFVALDRHSARLEVLEDAFVDRLLGGTPSRTGHDQGALAPGDLVVLLGLPYETHGAPTLRRIAERQAVEFLPLVYDATPLIESSWSPPRTELEDGRFSRALRALLETSSVVLVPSIATREELRAVIGAFGIQAPPIEVIELGADLPTSRRPAVVPPVAPGSFVLAVGTIQPRKNYRLIVDLWRSAEGLTFANRCGLVIAGSRGWGEADLLKTLDVETRRKDRIVHLADCDDELLAWLYHNCRFTVLPSWAEGYGLPVVESLRHGKVCVASNDPAVIEAGHGRAIHLDPHDREAWRSTIMQLLEDPRRLAAAEQNLGDHDGWVSWQSSAERLIDLATGVPYRDPPRRQMSESVAVGPTPSGDGGTHPLFDSGWYLEVNPDVAAAGGDPLQHYVQHGWREGRNPHPLFAVPFYLRLYPDVAAVGIDPVMHYLRQGARERRRPHPLFDPAHYCRRLGAEPENPLVHFLASEPGADPHPLFDVRWYLEANPDIADGGMNPLVHYARYGWKEGRSPHPLFDADRYLRRERDVAAAGIDPLAHYLESGAREGRRPHPLFDADYYSRQLDEDPPNALVHYLTHSVGNDPHPLFDTTYYSTRYPEAAAFARPALADYVTAGVRAGRSPHPLFDPGFYRAQVPDLGHDDDPLLHYLEFGWESFDPHPLFRTRAYLARHPEANARRTPLEHFVTTGSAQGLTGSTGANLAARLLARPRDATPEVAPFDPCGVPVRSARPRVLVVNADVPDADRDGGSWCLVGEMRALSDLGFAVTLATPDLEQDERAASALEAEGIAVATAERDGSLADLVADLEGLVLVYGCQLECTEAVYPILRRRRPEVPLILWLGDLHSLRESRERTVLGGLAAVRPERTRARELALASVADAVLSYSEVEIAELRRALPSVRILRLPVAFPPSAGNPSLAGRSGAVVVGSFLHRPNADAVRWLATAVWPLVRAQAPDATVAICGSGMRSDLFGFSAAGVCFEGHAPDLDERFSRARVHVAPLRFGAGIKIKVLRALGAGLPSVLTNVAAEGIGLRAGVDAFVADDPAELASAVVRLLRDDDLWRRTSARSLAFSRRHLDPVLLRRALAGALDAIGIEVPSP